jgi:hypothetical protein
MPSPTRSQEWFRHQVAALGALLRRRPPHRQEALLEELADETPSQPVDRRHTAAAKTPTNDTPAPD